MKMKECIAYCGLDCETLEARMERKDSDGVS